MTKNPKKGKPKKVANKKPLLHASVAFATLGPPPSWARPITLGH